MQSTYKYFLGSLFLTAVLSAPSAMNAAGPRNNAAQDEHRDEHRVYDRDHKDYHNWDDREDRSYRIYLSEHHRQYRPFVEIKVKDQRNYWSWRHEHPDHDDHGGR
jgi:hypothetical protein